MACEVSGCSAPVVAMLTYLRPHSGKWVRRPLCSEHGGVIWRALPAPLKETAVMDDPARPPSFAPEDYEDAR